MKGSLRYLFNAALQQKSVPSDWRRGLIVPLFKEGDKELASNYRGITLLSIVGKLFATIIEKRLSRWCEDKRIFEQEQAGFRAGRSTVNHIFTLAEIIRRKKRMNKPTYACFLDIKKAIPCGEKAFGTNSKELVSIVICCKLLRTCTRRLRVALY